MVVIPKDYSEKKKIVKLTQAEIDIIIEELERMPHNIFQFLKMYQIINKLREAKCTSTLR